MSATSAATAVAHGGKTTGKTTSARVRRKQAHGGEHEEEGGSERWLVTYADMLTLLLVLFIVLFSISVVNTSKFISLKTGLSAVFGDGTAGVMGGGNGLIDNASDGSTSQQAAEGMPISATTNKTLSDAQTRAQLQEMVRKSAAATRQTDFADTEAALRRQLDRAGVSKSVRFAVNRRGLVITVVTDGLVFPGNSATLLTGGQRIMHVLAPALARQHRNIEVDGFTNQLPGGTGPYPSGWELSSARASTVVRYLAAHGVAQSRLTAVGYSDQRPLYPASDPRAATLNRRVEIVVLS